MRSLTTAIIAEKNKLNTTSAWLTLLQIYLPSGTVLYLVPNPAAVLFDSQTYTPFPCTVDTVKTDSRGGLSDVTVTVSNVDRSMSGFVETEDLRGAQVRILTVNSANLADPAAVASDEEYEITEITITEEWAVFRLGHSRLMQQRFPNGRFLRDNCRWIYKTAECGYAGGLTTCDKILEGSNGCRAHSNQSRFGGFPGIPSVSGRS